MANHTGRMRRLLTAAACIVMVCGICASCQNSSGDDTSHASSSHASSSSGGIDQMVNNHAGQKMASSLEAYIDQSIEDMKNDQFIAEADPTGKALERTLSVLRAAKERGELSSYDYENAWSGYKQCMLDRGYKEIILTKLPNGLYKEAGHRGGTPEQETRYSNDNTDCMAMHVFGIDGVYQVQVGNPNLYRNSFEAIIDCFHRSNIAPKTYSTDDLKHDLFDARTPDEMIVNRESPDAQACFVANNMNVASNNDPLEELW